MVTTFRPSAVRLLPFPLTVRTVTLPDDVIVVLGGSGVGFVIGPGKVGPVWANTSIAKNCIASSAEGTSTAKRRSGIFTDSSPCRNGSVSAMLQEKGLKRSCWSSTLLRLSPLVLTTGPDSPDPRPGRGQDGGLPRPRIDEGVDLE